MQNRYDRKIIGFSLLEVLLVITVISFITVMVIGFLDKKTEAMRVDRTVLQMQTILNAGMAYYVANNAWPGVSGTDYFTDATSPLYGTYLPGASVVNPWVGTAYIFSYSATSVQQTMPVNTFYVYTDVNVLGSAASAKQVALCRVIAGKLATGYCRTSGGYARVYAYASIPAQSLNNAMAMNFAGIYHQGGCVPQPVCPTTSTGGNMTPQVFIVPISVSGVNDNGSSDAYPISSFTAYPSEATPQAGPTRCQNSSIIANPVCTGGNTSGKYWRACLRIITERGDVQVTRTDNVGSASDPDSWGKEVAMAAFTRCAINGEPSGSDFTVWGN